MSSDARKHHWVPQCYLRGFAGKGGKLFVVDGGQRKVFQTGPANVAAQRDFNRINDNQEQRNVVESAYATFETRLSASLRNVEKSHSVSDINDLGLIIDLIAILAVRGPRMRLDHKRMAEFQLNSTLRQMARAEPKAKEALGIFCSTGDRDDHDALPGHIVPGSFSVSVPTVEYVRMELRLAPEVRDCLTTRRWALISAAPDSGGFITTDDPVTLVRTDAGSGNTVSSYGFADRNKDVFFPVSNDLAIMGRTNGRSGAGVADRRQVAIINGWVACHAWRQVYARDRQSLYMVDEACGVQSVSSLLADLARAAVAQGSQ